ncbi:MAG: RAD55 family ATPase [Thermoplasmata archaeon]
MSEPAELLLYQALHTAGEIGQIVRVEGGSVTPIPGATYLGVPIGHIVEELTRRGILTHSQGPTDRFDIELDHLPQSVQVLDAIEHTLRDCGYEVQIPTSIKGKSGVEHYFDVLARGIGRQFMLDVVAPAPPTLPGQLQVLSHYAKSVDTPESSPHPLLAVAPRLSEYARRLTEAYGIDIIEAELVEELPVRIRALVSSPVVTVGHVSTGITALDKMLGGGLVEGRVYLLLGDVGAGKTALALQFLLAAAHRGERGLLVTTNSSPTEEVALADNLGFDLRAQVRRGMITVLGPSNAFDSVRDGGGSAEAEKRTSARVLEELFARVQETDPKRIVIDTVTPFVPARQYGEVRDFMRGLSRLNRLTLITKEFGLDGSDTAIEEYFVTGVVVLHRRAHPGGAIEWTARVEKHRGATHDTTIHPMKIERSVGVTVQ